MNKIEVIDKEALDILQHLVGSGFASVVVRYLNDSEHYIQQMDLAFKKASYSDLFELAHTLKGSSGTISASQLHDICAELERAAISRPSFGQLAQLLNAVETEFQEVKQALLTYLETSIKDVTESTLP